MHRDALLNLVNGVYVGGWFGNNQGWFGRMDSLRSLLIFGGVVAAVLVVATIFVDATTQTTVWPCESHEGLTPICEDDVAGGAIESPEDIVGLPDSDWIILSEFGRKHIFGKLTALNETTLERVILTWTVDKDAGFPECDAPDPAAFQPHGIDLSADGRRLLVVNHHPTDRVEFFDVNQSSRGEVTGLTWKGCVLYHEGGDYHLNDVVAFGDQGLIASRMSANAWYSYVLLFLSIPNGWAEKWTPAAGWEQVKNSRAVFPNGVEISADQQTLYVASYGQKQVLKIDLESGKRANSIRLSIFVDNMSWSQDGSRLLVTGQRAWHITALKCQLVEEGNCNQPFGVVAMDPQTLAGQDILVRDPVVVYGAGTVALERGEVLWIGSHQSDRLARFDLRELAGDSLPD